MKNPDRYCVYILRCADGTLYTGIARDPAARCRAHNEGRGAKYTRARRPVRRVYIETCADRSSALKREAAIKRMTRAEKMKLIASGRRGARARPAPFRPGPTASR